MKFHLNYTSPKFDFEIDHNQKIFLIGSCFSENIGNLLDQHKFKAYSNPSGILFNPASIHQNLVDILNLKDLSDNYILTRDGIYYSYLHHTSINAPTANKLKEKADLETQKAHTTLKESDHLIITFGTAFFYHHLTSGQVVANCHKQPQQIFEKNLLAVNELVSAYSGLIKKLQIFNPKLKIIFTVSPVKYLKDGVIENSLSKSALILSIHELIKQHKNCYYFPAYELVNDDLRDHRFYKEDLAHPNELAINYVWEKFSETCFSPKTLALNNQINKLNLALDHREISAGSQEQQKLQEFIAKQKEEIKKLYPKIEF
ncbi:MAG: GSCFA domain-containing protein [Bacteroidetes bacterium]|nr:GSCFA domain-containing protein [Bacteroidota bacterium]